MLATSIRISREHLLSYGEFSHLYNHFNLQIVRWRRKPRWLPVAPSKMFRIPVKPKIPPEELLEIRTMYNHYKTDMKSLRSYFVLKSEELLTGKGAIADREKIEEEEHQESLKLNEQWNKNIAIMREERIAKEKEEELEKIVRVIEENKIKTQARKEELEAIVRREKELSKYYITPQNIDAAIETALSKEVDHNFSIDLNGKIFEGRNTKPEINDIKKPEEAAAIV